MKSINAALAFKRRMRAQQAAPPAPPAIAPPPPAPPLVLTGNAALDHQARIRHAAALAQLDALREQRHAAALDQVRTEQTEFELALQQLEADEARLRQLPRGEARTAMLRDELLPRWRPVVDAYVAAGEAHPNPIAVKVMIWLFNVYDLEAALPLADLLEAQGQRMPDNFKREIPVFVADALLEAAEDRHARHQPLPDDFGLRAAAIVENAAMPDIVRIKYAKFMGDLLSDDDPALALSMYERADAIDPRKAQVKTRLNKLRKQLDT